MKRPRKILIRSFATLSILFALSLLVIGWYGSGHLLSPHRRELQDYHREILADGDEFGLGIEARTAADGTPYLVVTPATHPGTARKSRELRAALSDSGTAIQEWNQIRGTVVLLHGHCGRKEDNLPICERFCAAGFRCLVPDLPGHGEHPAPHATFGKNEAGLIENLLLEDAAGNRPDAGKPAFLFGVSQGGAVALLTAARNPSLWSGVVSVSSFTSLDEVVRSSALAFTPVTRPMAPLFYQAVACGTQWRAGLWPDEVRPADCAKTLDLPVMIAHGDADTYIPISHGETIFRNVPCDTKEFYRVEGGDHGWVLAKDANRLYPAICAFMLATVAE